MLLTRRRFLTTLAAVPVAGVLPVQSAPVTAMEVILAHEAGYGLHALINDGTQAPTYGGISRDTGLPAFYRTHHARVNQLHTELHAMNRR